MDKYQDTIVYSDHIDGHYIEMIDHMVDYIISREGKSHRIIFVINDIYLNRYSNSSVENIEFVYINSQKNKSCYSEIKKLINLRNIIVKLHIKKVIWLSTMNYLPFIWIFIGTSVKFKSIIYSIYLYKWNSLSFLNKFVEIIKYIILTRSKFFEKIYILNDKASAIILNKLYRIKLFSYIPDPIYDTDQFSFIINEFGKNLPNCEISASSKFTYLHCGFLSERKGTLLIIDSLKYINPEMMANVRIVFAGMVDDKLKLILEKKIQEIAPQIEFIHYLGFQNYESMRQLFSASNFVLLPYSNINQSSGILGWSVKYKVPIVTSANGFLGKIVGRYSIGYLLPSLNVCEISRFINNSSQHQLSLSSEKYSVDRSSKIFSSIILNND